MKLPLLINIITIVFLLTVSCESQQQLDPIIQDNKQKVYEEKDLLVMIDKNTCKLYSDYVHTKRNSLKGMWREKAQWIAKTTDTCWFHIKSVNKHIKYNFDGTRDYLMTTIYEDKTQPEIEKGEYLINNYNDSTVLVTAPYYDHNTIHNEGDTMTFFQYLLTWKNDTTIYLKTETEDNFRIFELIKTRANTI